MIIQSFNVFVCIITKMSCTQEDKVTASVFDILRTSLVRNVSFNFFFSWLVFHMNIVDRCTGIQFFQSFVNNCSLCVLIVPTYMATEPQPYHERLLQITCDSTRFAYIQYTNDIIITMLVCRWISHLFQLQSFALFQLLFL